MDKELKELLYSIVHLLRELFVGQSVINDTLDDLYNILEKHDDDGITFEKVDN